MQRQLFIFILALAGCSGGELSSSDTDSGTAADSGAGQDTGVKPDAGGAPEDSGIASDSGAASDSGSAEDAGAPSDAGEVIDAGDLDGGAPSGACTNPADEAVHMNTDVSAGVEMCASDCFGGRPCTRDCIIMNVGLSMECTECYVDAVSCTIQNCIGDCAGSDSAACEQCRDQAGCTAGFRTCSGFSS